MNARMSLAVACAALLALAVGNWALPVDAQGPARVNPRTLEQARAAALKLLTVPIKEYTEVQGAGLTWTDPARQTASLSVLKTSGRNVVFSGFRLDPLIVQGRFSNVTAKATFEILEAVGGGLSVHVAICDWSCSGYNRAKWWNITPGMKPYTLTAGPVTLEPNVQYVIQATLYADSNNSPNRVSGAAARITDIKWEF